MAKRIVHVNQLIIRGNAKHDKCEPPIAVRGKGHGPVEYGHDADLLFNGQVVGTFRYSPNHPLDCGAKLWFETDTLEVVPRIWDDNKKAKEMNHE